MSRSQTPPSDKDIDEMSETEKDRLLERMAERYADDDPVFARACELAAQASPSEGSN